jgi:hypothetical protein
MHISSRSEGVAFSQRKDINKLTKGKMEAKKKHYQVNFTISWQNVKQKRDDTSPCTQFI